MSVATVSSRAQEVEEITDIALRAVERWWEERLRTACDEVTRREPNGLDRLRFEPHQCGFADADAVEGGRRQFREYVGDRRAEEEAPNLLTGGERPFDRKMHDNTS